MTSEASNILRRFIQVTAPLDPSQLGYLAKSARTLDPGDLRKLATEIESLPRDRKPVTQRGPFVRVDKPVSPATEIRGIAKAIARYGGPDAVQRDADQVLVDAINRAGWTSPQPRPEVSVRPEGLPDSVTDRLQDLADE